MKISTIHKNNFVIVEFEANKLDAINSVDFKNEIDSVLKNSNNIVLDFSPILYVDSTGIGAMLSVYRKVNELQGILIFSSLSEMVNKIISISKLETVFTITNNIQEAEKAFAGQVKS